MSFSANNISERINVNKDTDGSVLKLQTASCLLLGMFCVLSILASDSLSWLRMLLFSGFFFLSFIRFKALKVPLLYWIFVLLILFFNIIAFIKGYFVFGKYSFIEAKLIIGYFIVFSFMIVFIKKEHIQIIDKSILIGSFLLSFYFIYMFLGLLNLNVLYFGDFLNQGYDLSMHGGKVKLYANHITILTFVFPYILVKTILGEGSRKQNIIALILTGLCTYISLRRGVILSAALGFLITVLILTIRKKKIIRRVLIIAITFIILLSGYFKISGADYEQYKKEIKSSFDFKKNPSNIIRYKQLVFFIKKISEKPAFGYGLGAHDPKYIRSKDNPAHYELGYLKMIYAGGLVTFIANLLLFSWAFFIAVRFINSDRLDLAGKIAPAFAGWLSLVIYHASNPIFSQFSYLFFYFYFFYLLNTYITELKEKNYY
jgi:hypothetical protein